MIQLSQEHDAYLLQLMMMQTGVVSNAKSRFILHKIEIVLGDFAIVKSNLRQITNVETDSAYCNVCMVTKHAK